VKKYCIILPLAVLLGVISLLWEVLSVLSIGGKIYMDVSNFPSEGAIMQL